MKIQIPVAVKRQKKTGKRYMHLTIRRDTYDRLWALREATRMPMAKIITFLVSQAEAGTNGRRGRAK